MVLFTPLLPYVLTWLFTSLVSTITKTNVRININMMTSSNGSLFCVAGPLWGESTAHWWIPGQEHRILMFSLFCAWTNRWANNRDTPVIWDAIALMMTSLYWRNIHLSHGVTHVSTSDVYIDGLVQDCSISSANTLEILQFCTKPSI